MSMSWLLLSCSIFNADLLDRNKRRIADLVETGKVRKRDRDYRPAAGTVLAREYKGVEYRVVATADGEYEFQGRTFASPCWWR